MSWIKPNVDTDGIVHQYLGEVTDMLLQREIAEGVGGGVDFAQANAAEDLAQAALHQLQIILHVDMLIFVEELRRNLVLVYAIQLPDFR